MSNTTMTYLQQRLLELAEAQALATYGCDLARLDPDSLESYTSRVTEANLDELVADLAAAAWQEY